MKAYGQPFKKPRLAMAFQDEWARSPSPINIHYVANKAAENFLDLLCMDRAEIGPLPEGTQPE